VGEGGGRGPVLEQDLAVLREVREEGDRSPAHGASGIADRTLDQGEGGQPLPVDAFDRPSGALDDARADVPGKAPSMMTVSTSITAIAAMMA
jgi:hypothetical protein